MKVGTAIPFMCISFVIVVVAGVAALIFVVVRYVWPAVKAWAARRRQQRAQEWRALAVSLGLEFNDRDPFGILPRYYHPLLHIGDKREVYHMMHGEYRGWGVKCFDYTYTIDGGNEREIHIMTLLLVDSPMFFEPLQIRPEDSVDRVRQTLGGEDIDFESDEFSRKYWVTSKNRKFAYDLLHTRAMEFLLAQRPLYIETHGNAVLFRFAEERFRLELPEHVQALLDMGIGFMELVPRYLVDDRRREPGPAR